MDDYVMTMRAASGVAGLGTLRTSMLYDGVAVLAVAAGAYSGYRFTHRWWGAAGGAALVAPFAFWVSLAGTFR